MRPADFRLQEATIEDIEEALRGGDLTARQLVQLYMNRIAAFDAAGPSINSIITVNPLALDVADDLDRTLRDSGPAGPLHGVPVILKDQIDAEGMPTTLGSILFKDYFPKRDAFVVERLKQAGAIILAKATLGELGQGDSHGSLYGSTKNPYDLERTVGGSSGGPAAAVAANFGAVAIGQEALASIRRPAAWNCVVGMRPTAGLVSRSGVFAGWPGTAASLGPLTRTVADQARILDVISGYDPEDPLTAVGVGRGPRSFSDGLVRDGLRGKRIGVLRESFGSGSDLDSEDYAKVLLVFDRAVNELQRSGAEIIDPIVIPDLRGLLSRRSGGAVAGRDDSWSVYFGRGVNPPFESRQEMLQAPEYAKVFRGPVLPSSPHSTGPQEYLLAREELMVNFLKVMADHELDSIVHRSVEHQPTLISEGVNPPFVNIKGATSLNTFLVYVPAISVPAGFTTDDLPVGVTFTGRPFSDAAMLQLAYAYEQATNHRRPPTAAPPLQGEP